MSHHNSRWLADLSHQTIPLGPRLPLFSEELPSNSILKALLHCRRTEISIKFLEGVPNTFRLQAPDNLDDLALVYHEFHSGLLCWALYICQN